MKILDENKIDLILTDQKMPEMTGVEFLKNVIPKHPDPFRLIVTGFSDTESIVEAINECGIYQYVTKPWKNEEMRFVIDKALEAYQMSMDNKQLLNQLREANEDLEKKVIDRTQKLNKQNDKIRHSINYAKRIQNAILPSIPDIKKKLPESFVLYKPKDVISGDFYWFGEVDGKDIFGAFDCTGHGVPGAFMTLIGNDLMNLITFVHKETNPAKILSRLHTEVVSQLRQDETQNQDGMDVSICVLDKATNTLEFAGAKNTLVYLQNGELKEIKGDKFPIGGTKGYESREFAKHKIQLDGKGQFYMFSDGYIDQFGGAEGRKFMRKQLKEVIQKIHDMPMEDQKAILDKTIINWMGAKETQIDDIVMLGFQA